MKALFSKGRAVLKLILALSLGLCVACQSPQSVDTRTPVLVELSVATVNSSSYSLSADACRRELEDSLEFDKGWRVLREGERSRETPRTVKVSLKESYLAEQEGTGTAVRVFSWLFLGPGYFWVEDHSFALRCQPRFSVIDERGAAIEFDRRSRDIDVNRMVNFHDWNGQVTWYLLSNVAPPFLAEPDEETLSGAMFADGASALVEDIDRALRAQSDEDIGQQYRVRRIAPEIKSPIRILSPKVGDKFEGSIPIEVAVVDSSSLVSVRVGQEEKQPLKSKTLRFQGKVNNGKIVLQFVERELGVVSIQLFLEKIGEKRAPKPEVTKAKPVKSKLERSSLVIRRILPELSTPIVIHAPRVGDSIEGTEVEIELEVVDKESLSFIKIGGETLKAPFEKTRYRGKVPIFNGRGNISLVSLSGELTRVRILTRPGKKRGGKKEAAEKRSK